MADALQRRVRALRAAAGLERDAVIMVRGMAEDGRERDLVLRGLARDGACKDAQRDLVAQLAVHGLRVVAAAAHAREDAREARRVGGRDPEKTAVAHRARGAVE